VEFFGESLAEFEKVVSARAESVEERAEVVDGAAGPACPVAVPVMLVELEAGGVVFVQSVSPGAVYATEVKRRPKPWFALLRTGYPGGTGNAG
jgi:hypothetical protein